mgnify:CR=1 FL=1
MLKIKSLLAIGVIVAAVMMGGCGETQHESTAYYAPNWMPDGRIICYKDVSRWSDAIWGRNDLGYKGYITAMSVDGTNEVDLFEISPGYAEMVCSPVGEKIAVYFPGYSEGISIYDYKGNKTDILTGEGANSADWSPDGTKIAYIYNRKLCVINSDGTNKTQLSSEAWGQVSWREINSIVYDFLYVIGPDGTNNRYLAYGGDGQITKDNYVVYTTGTATPGIKEVRKISLDGTGDISVFYNYKRTTLKLSFDNTKIGGGDLETGGGSWIRGIWVRNIDGTGEKKLR